METDKNEDHLPISNESYEAVAEENEEIEGESQEEEPRHTEDQFIEEDRETSYAERKSMDPAPTTVDFSGQGLTLVPGSLFKRTDIVYLNLSSNNIRNVPSDIGHLTWLTKLDLSRNGLRCQNLTDYNTLPMEMTQLENLIELNISECNLVFIPATIWLLSTLQILNLSRNKVREIPKDIGNLTELRHLNAQQMGLTTIPETIVCCERLETILLYGNAIDKLPDSLRECGQLQILSLNYRHFCSSLDEVVDNMLKKGQIRSEHLPSVLFDIPKIKRLHLERCMLNDLPETINEKVEELGLSNNYFTFIPSAILQLGFLQKLNLCRNMISELPPDFIKLQSLQWINLRENLLCDIFPVLSQLHNLRYINVGKNKITSLSNDIGNLQQLRELHLDENEITELPDEICSMISLETLDLSYNQLSSLPLKMHQLNNIQGAHGFNGLFRRGLWLLGNPLTAPEPQIWRCTNHHTIWSHLKKLEIRQVKNLHPLKIIVLGNYQCGKTSFINTLSTGKFQSMIPIKGTTKAFNQIMWKTENKINFVILDVGGHPIYETLCPKFIDEEALYLVTFDAFSYWKDNNFDTQIGQWLTLLYQICPTAVVKLVGLKVDLLLQHLKDLYESNENTDISRSKQDVPPMGSPNENESKGFDQPYISDLHDILDKLNEQLNEEVEQFHRYMQSHKYQNNFHYDSPVNEDVKLRVLPAASWFTVLMDDSEAFTEFTNDLELIAIDLRFFPKNQDSIPQHWLTYSKLLKQSRQFILPIEEALSVGKTLHMDDKETRTCLQYLHLIGSVFWQGRDTVLQHQVFPRIHWLKEKLGRLLRVDMEEALCYEDNLLFKCQANLSKNDFLEMRELLLMRGLLSYSAITCLMLSLSGGLEEMYLFQELAEHFQVGYSMTLPLIPQGKLHQLPVIIFPILNRQPPPQNFYEVEWPSPCPLEDYLFEKTTIYVFPMGKPLGLFENLSVCVHAHVEGRLDFQGVTLAWAEQDEILLEEGENEMNEYTLQFVLRRRHKDETQEIMAESGRGLDLWIHNFINSFLSSRPGIIFGVKQEE